MEAALHNSTATGAALALPLYAKEQRQSVADKNEGSQNKRWHIRPFFVQRRSEVHDGSFPAIKTYLPVGCNSREKVTLDLQAFKLVHDRQYGFVFDILVTDDQHRLLRIFALRVHNGCSIVPATTQGTLSFTGRCQRQRLVGEY